MALLTTPNHCDIQRRRRVGGFAAEITPTGRRDTQANWDNFEVCTALQRLVLLSVRLATLEPPLGRPRPLRSTRSPNSRGLAREAMGRRPHGVITATMMSDNKAAKAREIGRIEG
ncbi:hypothetical protein THAOC_34543 [Thalassiosira oceanica]|uniref:Uncharacterized protein n=1 Tax=Thalassiosira oceanica TaxID=159749 RepID=K0R4T3_THAOC|nr:hypothetical protein THAOC_34543 [Thalassiosira oceanica]|eukprot:EJK46769.1 hypothetical protein THAOC_34543 [Thalassiosira oceanica]